MKRSFGTQSGGMLKTFRRGVRAGVTGETYAHSSTSSNHNKSLSLSTTTTTAPFSRPLLLSSSATRIFNDDFDWVSVNENDNDNYGDDVDGEVELGNANMSSDYVDDDVFGLVPSRDEVINAVSSLQLVVDPTHYSQFLQDSRDYNLAYTESQENKSPTRFPSRVSSFGSETDWIEPSLHLCYPMVLEKHSSIRVYDALHLLQTEPSIKRMVISLSSDRAVWEAVLNNEMVRQLRDSMSTVENKKDGDDNNGEPERVTNIFSWVYEKTMVKMIALIEKIAELVNELFQISEVEERDKSTTGKTEEMLQISLILSIMVLLIVVVNRGHWA